MRKKSHIFLIQVRDYYHLFSFVTSHAKQSVTVREKIVMGTVVESFAIKIHNTIFGNIIATWLDSTFVFVFFGNNNIQFFTIEKH